MLPPARPLPQQRKSSLSSLIKAVVVGISLLIVVWFLIIIVRTPPRTSRHLQEQQASHQHFQRSHQQRKTEDESAADTQRENIAAVSDGTHSKKSVVQQQLQDEEARKQNTFETEEPEKLQRVFPNYNKKVNQPMSSSSESSFPNQRYAQPERRQAVLAALNHSWSGYKKFAFGHDELRPMAAGRGRKQTWYDWSENGGLALTLIDAMDTLFLAGFDEEVAIALDYVENKLTWKKPGVEVSAFELTIRAIGGLLSMYQRTKHRFLLDKAIELGDILLQCYDNPRNGGVPDNLIDLATGHHRPNPWCHPASILSEFGTHQMEFYALSQESGNFLYWEKARGVIEKIRPGCKETGYCQFKVQEGVPQGGPVGFGAFGDSFYEYLLKVWLLSDRKESMFREMWDAASRHVMEASSIRGRFLVVDGKTRKHTMEHLACFTGGIFSLDLLQQQQSSATVDGMSFPKFSKKERRRRLHFAEQVAESCHEMYRSTRYGLGPDVVFFGPNGEVTVKDGKYALRPEAIETFFYLWRLTRNETYRDWAWEIFEAIEANLKTEYGYVGAVDVASHPISKKDNMETFWLAETLKYLLLIFSEDSLLDLNEWVLNTEAHPLKIKRP